LKTDRAAPAARSIVGSARERPLGLAKFRLVAPPMHASLTQSQLLLIGLTASLSLAVLLVVRVLLSGREKGLRIAM
jgi:hypothetical protein